LSGTGASRLGCPSPVGAVPKPLLWSISIVGTRSDGAIGTAHCLTSL